MQTYRISEITIKRNKDTRMYEVILCDCIFAKFLARQDARRFKDAMICNMKYWKQFNENRRTV